MSSVRWRRGLLLWLLWGVKCSLGFTLPSCIRQYRSFLAATSSEASEEAEAFNFVVDPNEPTLYDILDSAPDATLEELKRNYIAIARASPDATLEELKRHSIALARGALPHALNGRNSLNSNSRDFSQIATAWRILSDSKLRQEYDRELLASGYNMDQSGQQEERATLATFSAVSAAAEDVKDSRDFKSAMGAALKNSQHANKMKEKFNEKSKKRTQRAVNQTKETMRLKSDLTTLMDERLHLALIQRLTESAMNQTQEATRLKEQRTLLIDERLHLSLRTRNSGLSSAEALKLMGELNDVYTISTVNQARQIRRVVTEIEELEQAEIDYYEKLDAQAVVKQGLEALEPPLLDAQKQVEMANLAFEQSKRGLKAAQDRVQQSKKALNDITKQYDLLFGQHRKAASVVGRFEKALNKQQERVRKGLQGKLQEVEEEKRKLNRGWKAALNERLEYVLNTPDGGMTANEAMEIFSKLNVVDSFVILDRSKRRQQLIDDIYALEQAELDNTEKQTEWKNLERNMQAGQQMLLTAQGEMESAIEAVDNGRKALELAQVQVGTSKTELYEMSNKVDAAVALHKRASSIVDKFAVTLEKRQERVRMELLKKQELMQDIRRKRGGLVDNHDPKQEGNNLERIEYLEHQEQHLTLEITRLEELADRMLSRAEELSSRRKRKKPRKK